MPNPTHDVRIMLAIVYYAGYGSEFALWLPSYLLFQSYQLTSNFSFHSWYKNGATTTLPESLRPTIEGLESYGQIKIAVNWVPDEGFDYLSLKFSNNFSSTLTPWVWERIQHVRTVKGY